VIVAEVIVQNPHPSNSFWEYNTGADQISISVLKLRPNNEEPILLVCVVRVFISEIAPDALRR